MHVCSSDSGFPFERTAHRSIGGGYVFSITQPQHTCGQKTPTLEQISVIYHIIFRKTSTSLCGALSLHRVQCINIKTFVLLIAQRVDKHGWSLKLVWWKVWEFMLALTIHHGKLVADCNFADINLAFVGKSISVFKIQFHKEVQPLVFSSLWN